MTTLIKMHFRHTDIGFCRVNYAYENNNGQTIKYCLMEDGSEVKLYRQSQDDEPDYPAGLPGVYVDFEQPPDGYGQELLRRYQEKEILSP